MKKSRACALGILSGTVEPVFAALTLLLASAVSAVLPWVLAVAAGCMYCVSVENLLPAAAEEEGGTAAAAVGFALMMLLDVVLG
jgi:ZIP family zinc transporter